MRVLMVCPELPSASNPGSMAPAARQMQSLRDLGVEIEVVDMRGIPKLKYMQAVPRIRRLAKSVDLIHSHFGYCGWLARVAPSTPLVMSFMGDDLLGTPKDDGSLEWFSRVMVRANKRLAPRCDAVIVKSQEMADVIAPVECNVIPNGVDVGVFEPMDQVTCRKQIGLSEGIKVLFPGDPSNPRKGWSLAAPAVERANELLQASPLHGENVAPDPPMELVPLWGVKPDEVALYMNACDAMVMTSMIEGSPNVVKEAMACDLPIVGVEVGDVRHMIEGVEGYSMCERDVEQMAQRLVELVRKQGAKGREAILERGLDLESVAGRVLAVYDEVLQSRRCFSSDNHNQSMRLVKTVTVDGKAQ